MDPARRSSPLQQQWKNWHHVPCAALVAVLVIASAGCSRKAIVAPEASAALGGSAALRAGLAADLAEAGPLHLQGEIGPGALWSIDRPADWNGELVIYCHGYSNPADAIALPNFGATRDALLAKGFAVAASSYSENGYAAKEGMEQSHQLRGIFASRVGQPKRTYVFGTSLGGLIGLLLAQKYPELYDGTMLVSGVVGGSRSEVEYLGDIRVLFDVVYPNVLPGGLEHPPVITDVNAQVVQPVSKAIQASPGGIVTILSLARHRLPGNGINEIINSLVTVLVFSMEGGGDLLDRAHEHTYFDNADWHYSGPGIPPLVEETINQQVARYRATPDAIAYLEHYGEPSGNLRTPLLSLHTTRDPVVPVWHEERLGAVDGGPFLLQRTIDRYGHTAFTVPELMSNFDDLVAWVRSGEKPVL